MRIRPFAVAASLILTGPLAAALPFPAALAQPPLEQARLTAPTPLANNAFGLSVAVDGDTLVALRLIPIAGPEHDVEALIYERTGSSSGWSLARQVPVGRMSTWLPVPVALDGDRMVVGVQIDPTLGGAIGGIASLHIHERDAGGPGTWGEVQRLGTEEPFDNFGAAVALEDDLLVVGSTEQIFPRPETAFVYRRDAQSGEWSEDGQLRPDDAALGDRFSARVAISGETVLVARGSFGLAQAIVFEPDSKGEWKQVAVLDVSSPTASFMPTIGLDGDRAVVQVFVPGTGSGIAVFERDQGGPNQWGRVATTYLDPGLSIGSSLSFSGDTVVAGAAFANTAYRFRRTGPGPLGWPLTAPFRPTSAPPFESFGDAIALAGETIVVGAPGTDGNTGSVYVFSTAQLFADGFESGGTSNWSAAVP